MDGGQISLDWVDNQASATYPESSTRPTVLILPGLTGNSQQSYVLHAIRQATRHGYRSVVIVTWLSPVLSNEILYVCSVLKSEVKCQHEISCPEAAVAVFTDTFFPRCVVFNNRGVAGEELLVSTMTTLHYVTIPFSPASWLPPELLCPSFLAQVLAFIQSIFKKSAFREVNKTPK